MRSILKPSRQTWSKRIPRLQYLQVLLLVGLHCLGSGAFAACPGEDVDCNEIDDATERALANRFKPAFVLHAGRVVGPEPVEINATNQDRMWIRTSDLYVRKYTVGGSIVDPMLPIAASPLANFSLNECRPVNAGSFVYYPVLDYGGPGNENIAAWLNSFATGPHRSLERPTVYARLLQVGGVWRIQYWMYYPFDDWVNKHEGDWEHITVHTNWQQGANPDLATYTTIVYFAHHSRIQVTGGDLNNLHVLDGTHPVVYVGGFERTTVCGRDETQGDYSGASLPAPGDWEHIQTFKLAGLHICAPLKDRVDLGGRFISHNQVTLVWMPNVRSSAILPGYWETHPDMEWMKANIFWGHFDQDNQAEVSCPLEACDRIEAADNAPPGPFYQSEDDAFAQYLPLSLSPLENHPKQIYVELLGDDGVVLTPEISISDEGGVVLTKKAPAYAFTHGVAGNVRVQVPSVVQQGDVGYRFLNWDDGSTRLCREVYILYGATLARANYSRAFTAVSSGISGTSGARALAWGDFDNDGWQDLFLADGQAASRLHLFRNTGGAGFQEVSVVSLSTTVPDVRGLACADFDNDGQLDVLVNTVSGKLLYRNTGQASFAEVAGGRPVLDPTAGAGSAWADFDRDGFVDVSYANAADRNAFVKNLGPSQPAVPLPSEWSSPSAWSWQLFRQSEAGLPEDVGVSRAIAWADYNKDKKPDFMLSNFGQASCGAPGSPNRLCKNATGSGAPTFVMANSECPSGTVGPLASVRARSLAWGDALSQNIPWPDLAMATDNGVKLFEVYNGIIAPAKPGSEVIAAEDSLMLVSVSPPYVSGLPTTGDFSGASWVDFNNDGRLDLSVARSDSLFLYESRDYGPETCPPTNIVAYRFSGMRLAALQSTGAFAWGDYDNDGDLDLVCAAHGSPAASVALYRNNTRTEAQQLTAANYFKVDLVGTLSNRAAIGAQVKVTTVVSPGHVEPQFREVEGGCGYSSFNSLTLEFGLGPSTAIQEVEIIWPSGKRDIRTGVAINDRVSFTEPVSVSATVSMSSVLQSGLSPTCPGGDGARMTTTLHFVDVPKRSVRSWELGLGKPPSNSGVQFYSESGDCTSGIEPASGDATPTNGFTTTFVKTRIGGRGTVQVPITWNGIPIASATLGVVSPDFTPTSPGKVDASDLTRLAQAMEGRRDNPPPGAPPYLPGADLNDDGYVDAGDVASFGQHLGQTCSWTSHASKVTLAQSPGENAPNHRARRSLAVTPNPANPTASVKYTVDEPSTVHVYLADVRGRIVRRLVTGFQRAGTYTVMWDGRDDDGKAVSSGIYWCTADTPTQRETRRVAVVR